MAGLMVEVEDAKAQQSISYCANRSRLGIQHCCAHWKQSLSALPSSVYHSRLQLSGPLRSRSSKQTPVSYLAGLILGQREAWAARNSYQASRVRHPNSVSAVRRQLASSA